MRKKIFNRISKKKFRKYLRNNSTRAEQLLWYQLKSKQLDGYKFRRQHGIGKYIVDFYCPKRSLVIEVDGDTHSTKEEIRYDQKRQRYIESLGIKVLRFTNEDIYERIDYILENIEDFINHP